jgi:hypothetical protein
VFECFYSQFRPTFVITVYSSEIAAVITAKA